MKRSRKANHAKKLKSGQSRENDCEKIEDPIKRILCKAEGPPPLDCNNVQDPILKQICGKADSDRGEPFPTQSL